MANVKITDLTALSATDVASNDVLPIVDINVDQTKKIAIADLITATSAANDFITFTQLNANLNVLDANADAIEARRDANVTVMNTADTALQTRLTTNVTAFTAEDVRINANLDVVQDNVAAVESRRTANVTVMNDADTALQARLTTNVSAFTAEDTALQVRINANSLSAASNDFITFTRLNANIDVVQDNVAGLTSTLTIRGDNASDDAVTLGSETLTFKGDTGLTTTVSSNTVTIDLDDTAVTAGLYGGVSGGTTNVTALTIDATGRITNAANVSVVTNLDTIQDNVVRVQQNAASNTDAVEARRVANIAGAISTVLTSDLTASRALLSSGSGKIAVSDVTSTELGHLDGVTGAIQTQIDGKQATITGAATTIDDADLTVSRALVSSDSGKVAVSAVTSTELGHLDGVSGAIQTQLDAKAALAGATFSGQVNMSDDLVVTGNLIVNGDTTTANSVNLIVQDRMVMLANSATGAPSADVGFLFNRGNQGNAAFFYDESASTFKLSDTKDPSSNTALSPVTASNLDVGIITVATVDATAIKQNGATLDNLIGSNVDGAISTVNDTDLTASRALVSSSGGKIEVSAVTATEIGHLDGVTSAIQTQIDSKQATITGAATTIDDADLTASRALLSSGSGKVAVSDVTSTELGHLDGVTSSIQTQINGLETRRDANVTVAASNNAALESRRTANIAGAVSTILTSDLTASRAMVTNSSGKVAVSAVTATELGHLDGVTSAIQTQIDSKQATISGAATTIDDADLTASRALVSSGSGKVAVSDVTSTELGHLDGVTSAIQTQFTGAETRRTSNIAGAISTVTTADLTASRALVSGSGGKIEVSAITSTELGHLDGITQNINSNLEALASGIAGAAGGAFPTGDYGLLDASNTATDSFGQTTGSLTTFDMLSAPSGSLATEDLGALS